jgi:thioredoxin-related protein
MLFRETVAVYCENHIEHSDTVRTSQETHYVSAKEPNRLMLFSETVAVYCENHTEHTDTVRTSQETYYVYATDPNRLMLFRETVAVYCENHKKPINRLHGQYAGLFSVQTRGTHSNHYILNDQLDYSKHITHSLTSVVGSGAGTRVKYTPLHVNSLRSALHWHVSYEQ